MTSGSSSNSNEEEEEEEVKNIPSPKDLLLLVKTALARDTQQPTKNSTSDGADIWDEIRPLRNVGGGGLPVNFDGYLRDEKSNGKINSAAVHGHQKTKRHTTTNRKTVSAMGGGVITRCDRG